MIYKSIAGEVSIDFDADLFSSLCPIDRSRHFPSVIHIAKLHRESGLQIRIANPRPSK
jgi:hypothetical protein